MQKTCIKRGFSLAESHSHHFSDHHDVWSSLLVDSQDIKESHVPENDIETIHSPPKHNGIFPTQPQPKANKEGCNGQKVGYIKIVTEPHLYLLAYFACFRHKHLKKKRWRREEDIHNMQSLVKLKASLLSRSHTNTLITVIIFKLYTS